ncbi:MAG: metallophosphoesterase [Prolixibacteraceae bacterium]|nr:metallophosphoesterase [Prolixibacteraceae bacterium]
MINTFKRIHLLFAFCLLFNGAAMAQKDTLSFLHITDLHVIFNQPGYPADLMEYRKQKQYDQGENRLREFLQSVPGKTNSDLVVATGDLVDFFESNTANGRMLDLQAEQFSRLLDDYHVPVFLTLGNHDLFSFNWKNGKLAHHQNSAGQARAAWIRNVPCFRNGTYYSESFQVGKTNYQFIFLDNGFYRFTPEDKFEVPYIDKAQLYWLNARLSESADDVEIIFMHIPLKDPVAQADYSKEIYSALAQHPSVKLIFVGHHHKNEIKRFPSGENKEMVQVQTGSLVQDTNNWRLVRLTENDIRVSVPGKTKNELVIPIK